MKKLPRLAFGNDSSLLETNVQVFSDRMRSVLTSLNAYEALGNPKDFQSKTCSLSINGLVMVASANSPVHVEIGGSNDMTLMIPLAGENTSFVDGKPMDWAVHQNGIFFPKMGRGGRAGYRSTLTMNLNEARLNAVALQMLGHNEQQVGALHLNQARLLPLVANGMNLDLHLRHICQMIEAHRNQPDVLAVLGIDDMVYRSAALLLGREAFLQEAQSAQRARTPYAPARRQLDNLCNQLLSQLDAPITLSDMERLSGLSARALQYAFLQRYACTPMQWLRNERLALARTRLRKRPISETVTQIALSCGFPGLSTFASAYSKRYGELPSFTLYQ
jgi:AraC-like DNA-binding protein